jgi:hypothetical protein
MDAIKIARAVAIFFAVLWTMMFALDLLTG